MIEQYSLEFDFAEIIPISAIRRDNHETLIKKLFERLPEGERLYDPEIFTDEIERNIAAELVREKILELTSRSHSTTAVRTEMWQEARARPKSIA